ncbi:MAG: hypothetical protein GYA24_15075 [Candidatus Lokiarchaeota archaeon]|nr:hypothetical protein [Candidatus Lokiarchaeota archaeon]
MGKKSAVKGGGASGLRGYLLQAMKALLGMLDSDQDWIALSLEPDPAKFEKIDIIWHYDDPSRDKHVQIKHSKNPVTSSIIKKWIADINKKHGDLVNKGLSIIGTFDKDAMELVKIGQVDGVRIDPPIPLDESLIINACISMLQQYLESRGISSIPHTQLATIVNSKITDIELLSTKQKRLARARFDAELREQTLRLVRIDPKIAQIPARHGMVHTQITISKMDEMGDIHDVYCVRIEGKIHDDGEADGMALDLELFGIKDETLVSLGHSIEGLYNGSSRWKRPWEIKGYASFDSTRIKGCDRVFAIVATVKCFHGEGPRITELISIYDPLNGAWFDEKNEGTVQDSFKIRIIDAGGSIPTRVREGGAILKQLEELIFIKDKCREYLKMMHMKPLNNPADLKTYLETRLRAITEDISVKITTFKDLVIEPPLLQYFGYANKNCIDQTLSDANDRGHAEFSKPLTRAQKLLRKQVPEWNSIPSLALLSTRDARINQDLSLMEEERGSEGVSRAIPAAVKPMPAPLVRNPSSKDGNSLSQTPGVDEIKNFVEYSEIESWQYVERSKRFIHRQYPALQIRIEGEHEKRDFVEEWAMRFPDKHAHKQTVSLYFNDTLLEDFLFVWVDGYRALLPAPDMRDRVTLTPLQDKLGRIVNNQPGLMEYEEYKQLAQLAVQNIDEEEITDPEQFLLVDILSHDPFSVHELEAIFGKTFRYRNSYSGGPKESKHDFVQRELPMTYREVRSVIKRMSSGHRAELKRILLSRNEKEIARKLDL